MIYYIDHVQLCETFQTSSLFPNPVGESIKRPPPKMEAIDLSMNKTHININNTSTVHEDLKVHGVGYIYLSEALS